MSDQDGGEDRGLGARFRQMFGLDRGRQPASDETDPAAVPSPPPVQDGAALMNAVIGWVHVLDAEIRGDPSLATWRRPYVVSNEPALTKSAIAQLEREERSELLRELLRRRMAATGDRSEAPDVAAIATPLLQQMAPLTPDEATDAMRFIAAGRFGPGDMGSPIPGLHPLLTGMERGEPGRFAGNVPLAAAYLALRERFPMLHPNPVQAQEIEARLTRLLEPSLPDVFTSSSQGYRPPIGAEPPPLPRLPRLASAEDARRVLEFAETYERLGLELAAWYEAQDRDPHWGPPGTFSRWRWEAARQAEEGLAVPPPPFLASGSALPSQDEQQARQRDDEVAAPPALAWCTTLDPPLPAWTLESSAIHAGAARSHSADGIAAPSIVTLAWRPSPQRLLDIPPAERGSPTASLLGEGRAAAERLLRAPGHDWAMDGVEQLALLTQDGGDLFDLLWKARSAEPGKGWLSTAETLRKGAAGMSRRAAAAAWIDRVAEGSRSAADPRDVPRALWYAAVEAEALAYMRRFGTPREAAIMALCTDAHFKRAPWIEPPSRLSNANDIVLRGAIWFIRDDAAQVPRLLRLALALLDKVPTHLGGVTYRSLVGINACIGALGRIATPDAVAALGRIQRRVRDQGLNKTIAKAMATAAATANMPIEDLEEISVPAFDLSGGTDPVVEIGLAGGCTATLSIASSTEAPVTLRTAEGRVPKSLPAAVKQDKPSAEALKALRATAKEVADVLGVQRLRLERSWLTGRTWTGHEFQERIVEHPLLGWFAARLVWTVTPAGGGPARSLALPTLDAAAPLDADDARLLPIGPEDVVALWHPLGGEGEAAVQAWRGFLDRHGIVQPIRQAWRETYPLTDAERATATYSNRFAGHVLRQAQANALARLRGWICRTRMDADVPNDEPTHLRLPALGLSAEFWTEGTGEPGEDRTEAGSLLYLRTDRVVFHRLEDAGDWRRDGGKGLRVTAERVPVEDVPAIAFSEVMRDVDLMVGVTSIGADPNWLDRGADAQHPSQWRQGPAHDYWQAFNAAALEGSGRLRHEFLATLLPKLAIAAQCSLEERHLVVQGRLRRYRIHLGSGASFVDGPGNYLCIVPDRRGAEDGPALRLPFEGDATLSLILSKAFLLARDDMITDPGILRQIG